MKTNQILLFILSVLISPISWSASEDCSKQTVELLVRLDPTNRFLTVEKHSNGSSDQFDHLRIFLDSNETYVGHYVEKGKIFVRVAIRTDRVVSLRTYVYDSEANKLAQETQTPNRWFRFSPEISPFQSSNEQ
jgi:hypothetical protein